MNKKVNIIIYPKGSIFKLNEDWWCRIATSSIATNSDLLYATLEIDSDNPRTLTRIAYIEFNPILGKKGAFGRLTESPYDFILSLRKKFKDEIKIKAYENSNSVVKDHLELINSEIDKIFCLGSVDEPHKKTISDSLW